MKVLIIIPAYNEESSLPKLYEKIAAHAPDCDAVVINDCSRDRTSQVSKRLGFKTIDLPVNLGIGGAVQTGYKYALYNNYDAAIQLDADGQHDPSYIGALVEQLSKGCNICTGSRFINHEGFQSSKARRIGIIYFCSLIRLVSGLKVTDPTSGFRACDKEAIRFFALDYPRDYPEPESLVNAKRNGLKICEVPVIMNRREEGSSSITSFKSVYYMIKVSLAIIIASISKIKPVRDVLDMEDKAI
ncbi:MAG: glycosyltransferase family 2 protein [Clostridiales bacterium]|nr:glycosyltransferase family 2 protein [Clostridiales bacterium]